jgi:hypothetical protein
MWATRAAWAPFCDGATLSARSPAIQRTKTSPARARPYPRVGTLLVAIGHVPIRRGYPLAGYTKITGQGTSESGEPFVRLEIIVERRDRLLAHAKLPAGSLSALRFSSSAREGMHHVGAWGQRCLLLQHPGKRDVLGLGVRVIALRAS